MKTNFKRIFAICLAVTLAFSSLAITASADTFKWDTVPEDATYTSNEYWADYYTWGKFYQNKNRIPLTGDGARDAVAVAASQIGYLEGDDEYGEMGTVGGYGNFTEYGKYTNANEAAWCASFCSWVMYAAKATDQRSYVASWNDDNGTSYNMARDGVSYWGETYVPHWSTMLNKNGDYRFADYYIPSYKPEQASYKPQTGNLIFFISSPTADWPLFEGHIGLVAYSDDQYVYTIEGNTSSQNGVEAEGGGVFFKKYALNSSSVAGYGILPYETVSGLPEIDYSGANPTPGLYVTVNGDAKVYANRDDDARTWTLPMSSIFEVLKIEKDNLGNTMLYSKFELGDGVHYGWIVNGTSENASEWTRTLQIYATPDGTPDHSDKLTFSGANLTITDDIAVNYKVDNSILTDNDYSDPYVVFEMNGKETTVTNYNVVKDEVVFELPNIAPHQMIDTITATLYATKDGEVCLGATYDYSIKQYCYNILNNSQYNSDAKLRTLIVDLLNYGAKSQEYMNYKTNSYVNANLTSTQKAWGSKTDRTLNSVLDTKYATVANPKVTWTAAGLNLKQSVGMRFRFDAESLDGLTVKVTSGDKEWVINSDSFETNVYGHYVFFDGFSVAQMSDEVLVTAYIGDTAVSDTLRYSIESYACAKLDDSDSTLVELVKLMMRYGDAAKAYVTP